MFGLLLALIFFGCDDPNLYSQREISPVVELGETVNTVGQIPAPVGYYRNFEGNEFEAWLRRAPLKSINAPVMLHNGEEKHNQDVHYRVLDFDVGSRDLQQCADAVMRLRGEFLYNSNQADLIAFNFTSGDRIAFQKWKSGQRPVVKGNNVGWQACSSCDSTYESFRKYMDNIFMFAGTASLSKELHSKNVEDLAIGDVFIQGGFPGHAVIVMDVAVSDRGSKVFLLAQSYMPAQDIHILKNYNNFGISPWYDLDEIEEYLETPEWTFSSSDLKSW